LRLTASTESFSHGSVFVFGCLSFNGATISIVDWQVECNHELSSSESLCCGILKFWLNTDENLTAVVEFIMRQGRATLQGLIALQSRAISNSMGIWSENTASPISRLWTGNPKDRIRSSVCPRSCVGLSKNILDIK